MNKLVESTVETTKEIIRNYLIQEGYGTYAKRLAAYKFYIADVWHEHYIAVAAMFPDYAEVVINPAMVDATKMFVAGDARDDVTKMMDQLSVLIRHELLHFLLVHQQRLYDHMKDTDPQFEVNYRKRSIQEVANEAMDYEISIEGYDAHDKEVIRLMTLNNRVVGGLIAEDDHPDWGKKTMEEMFDILRKEHEDNLRNNPQQQISKVTIHRATHSPEYTNMYNKIIQLFDDSQYSEGDLATVLAAASSGDDVINPVFGEVILMKGE